MKKSRMKYLLIVYPFCTSLSHHPIMWRTLQLNWDNHELQWVSFASVGQKSADLYWSSSCVILGVLQHLIKVKLLHLSRCWNGDVIGSSVPSCAVWPICEFLPDRPTYQSVFNTDCWETWLDLVLINRTHSGKLDVPSVVSHSRIRCRY